jgi:hypothetical protein
MHGNITGITDLVAATRRARAVQEKTQMAGKARP